MTTITIDLPDDAYTALRLSPTKFVREMRIASSVQWYAQQQISQEKAANLTGLSRAEFIEELLRRDIPAIQLSISDLEQEING